MYELKEINRKKVFIFEDHATAILPWAEIRKQYSSPLNLLTLDYHSDTSESFRKYLYHKTNGDVNEMNRKRSELIEQVDINNINSLEQNLKLLHHDEQIDFAIRTNILNFVSVIHLDGASNEYVHSQDYPDSKILILPNMCAVNCTKIPHDDACIELHSNEAIETVNLEDKIEKINNISKNEKINAGLGNPYILDIDLDYFRTMKSINPVNISTFHNLITKSAAMSIAKESECVLECRLEGETITSEILLAEMLKIVSDATTA